MRDVLKIWNDWCAAHSIAQDGVPLFQTNHGEIVATKQIGRSPRPVLLRDPDMEALVIQEANTLVTDWERGEHLYDGLIYMMFTLKEQHVLPLYIGKAESIGKGDKNLSVNIKSLARDKSKFARWGDNYAYHIGDLSAAALTGHPPEKVNPKYTRWAAALFETVEDGNVRLHQRTYFWVKAWRSTDVGIWTEMRPMRLSFLEYLLIGVASSAFGTNVLNYEGRNR